MRRAVIGLGLALSVATARAVMVVLPDEPTPVERSAAEELRQGLERMTGVSPTVVREGGATAGDRFFVGATAVAAAATNADGVAAWRADEIYLKRVPQGVVLAGHPTRGPLYAVDTLLERHFGVRWWTSTEADYPRRERIALPDVNERYAPPFAYRETYYLDGFDPLFKVRSKGNFTSRTRYMLTGIRRIPAELGGDHSLYFYEGRKSAYHSFFEILPPQTYFKDHPDWYSLVNGKRAAKQLCLTNREMTEAYIRETLRRLEEDPTVDFIQVSQNDVLGGCECAACRALDEAEGGTAAGSALRFVNTVAEAVERRFPAVRIDTFAYMHTRKAPARIQPRRNVVVRLCDFECSFARPLGQGGPRNADFVRDLSGWSKVAKGRLFIWDYLANFTSYMLPHPNQRSQAPNIRLFAEAGAVGVFEQGDALCSAGEFARLRHWVVSHLLWDPAQDERRLEDDFLRGYYGADAAAHLRRYLDLVNGPTEPPDALVRCYHANVTNFMTDATAVAAAAAMVAAERAAGEPFASRVRRERLSIDHAFILNWDRYRDWTARNGLAWPLPEGTRGELVARWLADCERFGVVAYRETTEAETFRKYVRDLKASVK